MSDLEGDIAGLIRLAMQKEMAFDEKTSAGHSRVSARIHIANDFARQIMDRVGPLPVYTLPKYTYVIQNTEANAGYDTEIVGSVQACSYEEAVTLAAQRGFNVSMFRSPYTLTRV